MLGYLKLALPATRFKPVRLKPGQVWEPGETERCTVAKGMPQDVRISPDGRRFYVVDGASFTQLGFIATGLGTHGLYPSRDGRRLYVANRGSHRIHGPARGSGSVIDFATEKVVARWGIPGGGSPEMGNVSADSRWLWLAAHFDDVISTVWPPPGRYSLGHTGNLR